VLPGKKYVSLQYRKGEVDVVQYQEGLFEVSSNRRGKEEKSMEELFKRPILHRQINGDKVYVPLDLVRLGWKVEH
jgi:hypothetical protein